MAIENREQNGEGDDRLVGVFEQAKIDARKKYEGKPLKELVVSMHNLRVIKEQAEADLKRIDAEYDVLRFEAIPTKMDDEGVERVAYDGIGRVSLTPDLRVSTKAGMKEKLFGWFKKNKCGDLIQPSVNASTLKAWVKERQKKAKPIPTEFLNIEPVTRASITKQ